MKKFGAAVVKVWAMLYLVQVGIGIGFGLYGGYYLAANFSPEEVQRIIDCVRGV